MEIRQMKINVPHYSELVGVDNEKGEWRQRRGYGRKRKGE